MSSDKVKVACYACLSDYMMHDKYSVVAFNDAVLKDFQARHPTLDVKKINYQSDGCGQHFKQKYMLCYITTVTGISINWHFTATSHGKGAVDGVGGCLKRRLQEDLKARKVDPTSIEELANYAAKVCPNISILYVSTEVIDGWKPKLDKIWNTGVHNIPETRKAHCFRSIQPYIISVHTISEDLEGFHVNFKSGEVTTIQLKECEQGKDDLKPGTWILVQYLLSKEKTKKYVAQILTNKDDTLHVKFLRHERKSKKFFSPAIGDEADIDKDQVIKILPEPQFDNRLKLNFQHI